MNMYSLKASLSICLILLMPFAWAQKDPVVLKVNDNPVSKSEFLQVYLKNNNEPAYDQASLDEYVQLFVDFKIKVEEAKALGYDTIPRLKSELKGYRNQLSNPYLVDSSRNRALVTEAYERMKYEVDASHILIQLKEDASPADTLKAYEKIMALKKRIKNGEDFAEVAMGKGGSDDPSVTDNKGRLGYFTAFQMVYPFESLAYNTKVGEVGGPVRTRFGYHIIKVHDKRPARGTMTAAHIMIAIPKGSIQAEIDKAMQKGEEIYEQLQNGESFDKLARLYSDDAGSRQNGGKLPTFGSGTSQRMIPEFEDEAFALQNNGDYSKPFRTKFGVHIVKRHDYKPIKSFDELKKTIEGKVNSGDRGKGAQDAFVLKLKDENKYKSFEKKRLNEFYENVDSTVFEGKWKGMDLKKDKTILKYNKKKYKNSDFMSFLKDYQTIKKPKSIVAFVNDGFKEWEKRTILNDEKSQLEDKYPEFKSLMKEYQDGVLLYEVMKNQVWDKAVKDTNGLKDFFAENTDNYRWEKRFNVEIYEASKKVFADSALVLISNNDSIKPKDVSELINKDSQLNITVKSGVFEESSLPFTVERELKEGINEIFFNEDKYFLVRVHEIVPATGKSLKEARGAAIQDYQVYLEKNWLEELRAKYPVEIYKEVLYSIGK